MLSKKIFYQKELVLHEISTKKLLIKNLYTKFLIRSNLLNSKNFKILEDNSKFFNISRVDLNALIFCRSSQFEGYSLNTRTALYVNKRNNALRFESFLCSSFSQSNLLENVHHSFKGLEQKSKANSQKNSLVILKPIKGGFSSYCSGIVGFLPQSHGLAAVKKLVLPQVLSQWKKNILNQFFFTERFTDKYFIHRLPFDLGQAVLYSKPKKNNFSSSSRKKKDFSTEYNFVFLVKAQKIESVSSQINSRKKENVFRFAAVAENSPKMFKPKKYKIYSSNAEVKKNSRN